MRTGYTKLISLGAAVALTGFITSGPLAFLLVKMLKPQPQWVSPAVFAANYSAIQDIPFYFGFLLIGGMLMLSAGHYLNYRQNDSRTKFHLLVAFGWTTVFCALIAFNYICQTTFVRNLARYYEPDHDAAIAMFSMANPMSFCWANEMWGYAFLGLATWLTAGYYLNRNNMVRILLVANGVISIAGAIWTIIDINWVMTTGGLVAYFAWNVVMIALMILIWMDARKTQAIAELNLTLNFSSPA